MSYPSFFKIVLVLMTIFSSATNFSQTTWNGSASTDWSDATNWSSGSVPTNSDDVIIPNGLVNYPILSINSNCRELDINAGSSLDINGFRISIRGSFINDGAFESSGGTAQLRLLATTGNYVLGGFSDTDIRIIKSSSGSYTSTGNIDCKSIRLNQNNIGTITIDGQTITANDYFLVESGKFLVSSGVFTATKNTGSTSNSGFNINGGTLDVDGGVVSFGEVTTNTADLNVNGGAIEISGGVLNVADELDVVNGLITQTGGVINIRNYEGTAQGSAQSKFDMLAGTLNLTNGVINILGQHSGAGNFSMVISSVVSVNSTVNHTINIFTNNASSDEDRYIDLAGNAIGNLIFNQTGHELYLANNFSVLGDLTISAGTFDLETYNVNVLGATINDGVLKIGTGTLDTEGSFDATNGTITFYGAGRLRMAANPISLGSMTTTIGTVEYDGGNQNVLADTYFNVEIDGSGTKTLPPNSFTIKGDLTLSAGTLSYNTATNNKTMSIKGNVLGTGNITATNPNILRFNGDGTIQELKGVSSDFIGVRVAGSANVITTGNVSCKYLDLMPGSTGSFTIDGETVTLNPTNGYLQLDGADLVVSAGSLINNSINQTNNYINSGTLTISGGAVQMTGNSGASGSGGDLNVNGGSILVSSGTLSVNDELDVATGTIIQTGGEIYIKANPSVNWNGTLDNKFDMEAGTLSLSGGILYLQAQATSLYNCIDIAAAVNTIIGTDYTIAVSQNNASLADDSYLKLNGHAIGNLTIDLNGKTAFLREPLIVEGNLTITNGTLDLENNSTVINGNAIISGILKLGLDNYDFNGAFNAAGGTVDFTENGNLYVSATNPIFGNLDDILGSVVLDGTSLQNINETLTFSTLSTNNSNGINLLASVQVRNGITLNSGIISVSSPNNIKLLSTCDVFGTPNISSHINGSLFREVDSNLDYTFPVGDGTFYRPVILTPEGSTATTFSVQFNNTAHASIAYDGNGNNNTPCGEGIDHVAMGSWWDISRVSGSENCFVGINWGAASGVDSPNDIRLSHWTGSEWENLGEVITGDDGFGLGSVSAGRVRSDTYVSSFSPFNLGSGNGGNSLPIELLSFNASCYQNSVEVQFSVLSQINNDYFLIQRSLDAIDWEVVGSIAGAGNSNTQLDYTFVDDSPLLNLSYYRLKQVDYDGKYKVFLPTSSSCDSYSEGIAVRIFPNPAYNELTIELSLERHQGDNVSFTILDASGKLVMSNYIELKKGFNKIALKIGTLSNGLYLLRFNQTKDYIKEVRLIKR